MRLAERCDLGGLVGEHVAIGGRDGVNAPIKVDSVVAGMLAGANSIDDLDVLRHGGVDKAVADMRATSTLGAFLRAFTWGNVRQLEKTERRLIHRSTTRILFSSGTRSRSARRSASSRASAR
jgi:hypothetical protein